MRGNCWICGYPMSQVLAAKYKGHHVHHTCIPMKEASKMNENAKPTPVLTPDIDNEGAVDHLLHNWQEEIARRHPLIRRWHKGDWPFITKMHGWLPLPPNFT